MVDMIGDMIEDMMGDINGGIIFYDIIIFQMHFISLFSHLLIVSILFRSKNEFTQQKSMHAFYEKAKLKNKRKIKLCITFLRIIYPLFNVIFVATFWMVGLVQYFKDN